MSDLIDVAVPFGVRKTFVYAVPPHLRDKMAPGMRVLVPFGRKLITGYVVGIPQKVPAGEFKLRLVQALLEPEPIISTSLVETARWKLPNFWLLKEQVVF